MTITASDGSRSFEAYGVAPPHAPAGAVVLIQEIFGIHGQGVGAAIANGRTAEALTAALA